MLEKDKRWVNKKYTNWVATLPCTNCGIDDGTVVAHHLKHRFFPWGGGGTGMKAHDWLTMALCYTWEEYQERCKTMPESIDWSIIEDKDNTTASPRS